MDFSSIVKNNLKRVGKTQRWLADQLQVTPGTVNKYLNNPSLDTIRRIDSVLPLPEAAGLLHSGERLRYYVGKEKQKMLVAEDTEASRNFLQNILKITNPESISDDAPPEILYGLESLTLAYSDVLEDPDARADFAELVQVIVELSQEQRRGLLQFVKGFDKREILQDGS